MSIMMYSKIKKLYTF